MALPKIGALWIDGPLSFVEQLCLQSFLDAGHEVVLYRYGNVTHIPEGVEVRDARTVLPDENFLTHKRSGSPAPHADQFRYLMLAQSHSQSEDMIWADTDAYCVKPFTTDTGHFYAWENHKHVASGVLGLPRGSVTLKKLVEFTSDEYAIPTWYGEKYTKELEAAKANGTPVHTTEQPWGVWGPHVVNHFLQETGEIEHAMTPETLYPIPYAERRKMLRPDFDCSHWITENTLSIHFYGRRIRPRIVNRYSGIPPEGSLVGQLLKKHDIDPEAAPIIKK